MLRWTEKKEGREEGGLSTLNRYFKCLLKTQIFPALTDKAVCEKEVRLNGISQSPLVGVAVSMLQMDLR